MKKLIFAFSIYFISSFFNFHFPQTVDPKKFIATLQFDEQYQDYLSSKKEQMFPVAFTFNNSQDGNADGNLDAEDACENIVQYAIGDSVFGTGRTGISNRGPNDQRPVVYFHFVKRGNYDVYEYWLYYADNDYLNDHEHDWEKYFVYVQDSTPLYVMISSHSAFNTFSWCELPMDGDHIIISVDGGSHAMGNNNQNGVKIRYNGQVSKNAGQLNTGDGLTFPWRIFSNDSTTPEKINYLQTPDEFLYGDPVYSGIPGISDNNDFGSPNPAPWKRSEWDNPPPVPIVNLGNDLSICTGNSITIDAGSNYTTYLWSNGLTSQIIPVDVPGSYSVTVIDNFGCSSKDSIEVTEVNESPLADFNYSNNGFSYLFSDSSLNAFSWEWNFGDGTGSNQKNANHNFPGPGIFTVCLNTSNNCGSDSACQTIYISPFSGTETNSSSVFIRVFQNPESKKVIIQLGKEIHPANYELKIYNTAGHLVFSSAIHKETTTFDLDQLTKGIYFCRILSDKKIIYADKIVLL